MEIRNDRVRLKIMASQVVYHCRKDKYLLTYNEILKLSILVAMSQLFRDKEYDEIEDIMVKRAYADRKLAESCRGMVSHSFTEFKDSKATWQQDFEHNF